MFIESDLWKSFPGSPSPKLQLTSHCPELYHNRGLFVFQTSHKNVRIHFKWINLIHIFTFLNQSLWPMHPIQALVLLYLNYSRNFFCNFILPGPCSRDFKGFPLPVGQHWKLSSNVPSIKLNRSILAATAGRLVHPAKRARSFPCPCLIPPFPWFIPCVSFPCFQCILQDPAQVLACSGWHPAHELMRVSSSF